MAIRTSGTARIRHNATGVTYQIDAEELEWDAAGGAERQMGPETEYVAEMEHPELGTLSWHLWEYPAGVESFQNEELNGHELVENFKISLEPDQDGEPDLEAAIAEMQKWFFANYTRIQLPHPSHYGGPYHPPEVLNEEFGDRYPYYLIQQVGDAIIHDSGIYDWARVREDDVAKGDLSPVLVQQVADFTLMIAPLVSIEVAAPTAPPLPGMGHNSPPNPIEELGLDHDFFRVLDKRVRRLGDLARQADEFLQETGVPVTPPSASTSSTSQLDPALGELAAAIRENTEAIRDQSAKLQSTVTKVGVVTAGGVYVADKMFDGLLGRIGELIVEKGAVMAPPLAAAVADYLHIVSAKLNSILDIAVQLIHTLPTLL